MFGQIISNPYGYKLRTFQVENYRTYIGKDQFCDIRVEHVEIAPQHCLIIISKNGSAKVRNLSQNKPTIVNGQIVATDIELKNDDVITVGPRHFVWKYCENSLPNTKNTNMSSLKRRRTYGSPPEQRLVVVPSKKNEEKGLPPKKRSRMGSENMPSPTRTSLIHGIQNTNSFKVCDYKLGGSTRSYTNVRTTSFNRPVSNSQATNVGRAYRSKIPIKFGFVNKTADLPKGTNNIFTFKGQSTPAHVKTSKLLTPKHFSHKASFSAGYSIRRPRVTEKIQTIRKNQSLNSANNGQEPIIHVVRPRLTKKEVRQIKILADDRQKNNNKSEENERQTNKKSIPVKKLNSFFKNDSFKTVNVATSDNSSSQSIYVSLSPTSSYFDKNSSISKNTTPMNLIPDTPSTITTESLAECPKTISSLNGGDSVSTSEQLNIDGQITPPNDGSYKIVMRSSKRDSIRKRIFNNSLKSCRLNLTDPDKRTPTDRNTHSVVMRSPKRESVSEPIRIDPIGTPLKTTSISNDFKNNLTSTLEDFEESEVVSRRKSLTNLDVSTEVLKSVRVTLTPKEEEFKKGSSEAENSFNVNNNEVNTNVKKNISKSLNLEETKYTRSLKKSRSLVEIFESTANNEKSRRNSKGTNICSSIPEPKISGTSKSSLKKNSIKSPLNNTRNSCNKQNRIVTSLEVSAGKMVTSTPRIINRTPIKIVWDLLPGEHGSVAKTRSRSKAAGTISLNQSTIGVSDSFDNNVKRLKWENEDNISNDNIEEFITLGSSIRSRCGESINSENSEVFDSRSESTTDNSVISLTRRRERSVNSRIKSSTLIPPKNIKTVKLKRNLSPSSSVTLQTSDSISYRRSKSLFSPLSSSNGNNNSTRSVIRPVLVTSIHDNDDTKSDSNKSLSSPGDSPNITNPNYKGDRSRSSLVTSVIHNNKSEITSAKNINDSKYRSKILSSSEASSKINSSSVSKRDMNRSSLNTAIQVKENKLSSEAPPNNRFRSRRSKTSSSPINYLKICDSPNPISTRRSSLQISLKNVDTIKSRSERLSSNVTSAKKIGLAKSRRSKRLSLPIISAKDNTNSKREMGQISSPISLEGFNNTKYRGSRSLSSTSISPKGTSNSKRGRMSSSVTSLEDVNSTMSRGSLKSEISSPRGTAHSRSRKSRSLSSTSTSPKGTSNSKRGRMSSSVTSLEDVDSTFSRSKRLSSNVTSAKKIGHATSRRSKSISLPIISPKGNLNSKRGRNKSNSMTSLEEIKYKTENTKTEPQITSTRRRKSSLTVNKLSKKNSIGDKVSKSPHSESKIVKKIKQCNSPRSFRKLNEKRISSIKRSETVQPRLHSSASKLKQIDEERKRGETSRSYSYPRKSYLPSQTGSKTSKINIQKGVRISKKSSNAPKIVNKPIDLLRTPSPIGKRGILMLHSRGTLSEGKIIKTSDTSVKRKIIDALSLEKSNAAAKKLKSEPPKSLDKKKVAALVLCHKKNPSPQKRSLQISSNDSKDDSAVEEMIRKPVLKSAFNNHFTPTVKKLRFACADDSLPSSTSNFMKTPIKKELLSKKDSINSESCTDLPLQDVMEEVKQFDPPKEDDIFSALLLSRKSSIDNSIKVAKPVRRLRSTVNKQLQNSSSVNLQTPTQHMKRVFFATPIANYCNVEGVKRNLQLTPQPDYSANISSVKNILQVSPVADYNKVSGVKRALQLTPEPNYNNVSGIKKALKLTPTADFTNVAGIKTMFELKPVADYANVTHMKRVFTTSPVANYTDVTGVKQMFTVPPKSDYNNTRGLKELIPTDSTSYLNVSGVRELFKDPIDKLTEEDEENNDKHLDTINNKLPSTEVTETTRTKYKKNINLTSPRKLRPRKKVTEISKEQCVTNKRKRGRPASRNTNELNVPSCKSFSSTENSVQIKPLDTVVTNIEGSFETLNRVGESAETTDISKASCSHTGHFETTNSNSKKTTKQNIRKRRTTSTVILDEETSKRGTRSKNKVEEESTGKITISRRTRAKDKVSNETMVNNSTKRTIRTRNKPSLTIRPRFSLRNKRRSVKLISILSNSKQVQSKKKTVQFNMQIKVKEMKKRRSSSVNSIGEAKQQSRKRASLKKVEPKPSYIEKPVLSSLGDKSKKISEVVQPKNSPEAVKKPRKRKIPDKTDSKNEVQNGRKRKSNEEKFTTKDRQKNSKAVGKNKQNSPKKLSPYPLRTRSMKVTKVVESKNSPEVVKKSRRKVPDNNTNLSPRVTRRKK